MKPTYDELVQALRKVKSNGTRVRYDTRDLINSLLTAIDEPDTSDIPEVGEEWFAKARLVRPGEPLGSVDHMPDERGTGPGENMESPFSYLRNSKAAQEAWAKGKKK